MDNLEQWTGKDDIVIAGLQKRHLSYAREASWAIMHTIYIYIYMFVGCVVLVINKSTTKQNNIRHST